MERTIINSDITINDNANSNFELSFFVSNKINLVLEKDQSCNLLLKEVIENFELNILVKENAKLDLSIFANKCFKNSKITVKLEQKSQFLGYFADFSNDCNKLQANILLIGNDTYAKWHLASLCSSNDNKEIDVSMIHQGLNTTGLVENYGVCKNNGKLIFSGVSTIEKGSHKSQTRQTAKIIIFDKESDAIAKPVLKIDEHDIEASHGAAVGKVNDEQLFYLTSRGLSENQAKELITFGYLKPILKGFVEEEIAQKILNRIEEKN